jgi:hypothetical protein
MTQAALCLPATEDGANSERSDGEKSKEPGTTKSFYGKHSSKNPEPLQLKTALMSKLPEIITLRKDASSHAKGHHCNLFTVIIIYYEYCIAIKLMLREWRFTLSAKVLKR